MKTIKLLAIISLALAAMVSPMGCLGRKKLQQKASEATPPSPVAESRLADVTTTEEQSSDAETIFQSPTGKSEVSEETVEPSHIEVGSMETEETTKESVSEETGSFETEASTEPSIESALSTDAPTTTMASQTEPVSVKPTEKPTTAPSSPSTIAPSESSAAVCQEHDFEYSEPVPPTCTSEGVMRLTCRVCGYVFEGPLDKTDHIWNNGEITTPATCNVDGVKTYTCSGCGKTRTEAIHSTGEHHYVATKTVQQTRIGTMADLGYTVYTCEGCWASYNDDYEGYLDCNWRYQKVNEYRTGAGRFLLLEDGSKVYFNIDGCVQLEPFTKNEGLESIAKLRAQQEAYDMYTEGTLNHEHDGMPYQYFYGSAFWFGYNCECCQAGGEGLDATFREEENAPYAQQGHLRIELNSMLKYIGIGAYVYKGWVVVVCEYSDVPD